MSVSSVAAFLSKEAQRKRQLLGESAKGEMGDHDHFVHHASEWIKHTGKAAQHDDAGRPEADHHYAEADKHWDHIQTRHGEAAAEHMASHVSDKASASKIYKQHGVKWKAGNV